MILWHCLRGNDVRQTFDIVRIKDMAAGHLFPSINLNERLTPHQKIQLQTLTWSKVPEDSSDFDETWTELIVMT